MIRLLYLILCCVQLPLPTQAAEDSAIVTPAPPKVLFLGNSITLHQPAPEIGWTGNWGMAASAEGKDYVHLLLAQMTAHWGRQPKSLVHNLADFERGYTTFAAAQQLASELAFEAEIIVLAIGENVPELTTSAAQQEFGAAVLKLLTTLKGQRHPTIFVRSCFWPHAMKDKLLQQASAEAGATFVDISALGRNPSNQAKSERAIAHAGVAGHPGDKGMQEIATMLWKAMQQHPNLPKARLRLLVQGEAATELAPHGLGNVYAPELQRDGERWLMWYGGQGRDGHDRIHLAESRDRLTWQRHGVVLDCGTANHVNDPSVVRVNGTWWMFYTVAPTGEQDSIAAATSADGITWEKRGVVLPTGPAGAWDSGKVGRPSVLHEGGKFRLWYDGQPTSAAAAAGSTAGLIKREGRAVGYAESPDGEHWQRREEPVFREGAGAVHVSRQPDRLIMVIESGQGVRWTQSNDGLHWQVGQPLLALTGEPADRFGQVTPFLLSEGNQSVLYFGAAARQTWDGNAIASLLVVVPR